MHARHLMAAALLALSSNAALAGPAADDARVHFNAIAGGDVALVSRQYADNAVLEWIGGPLDGSYAGVDKIRETWGKFVKGNPDLKVTIDKLEESVNPKGATVTANVQFTGKQPIKVRYVLTYRDGKLVHETWQIDPKLSVAGH